MLYHIIPLYRSNIIRFTDDNEVDIPIFRTEEGRYLASCTYGEQYRYMCRIFAAVMPKNINYPSALGDPLIKGLTEVAKSRPKDPVTYLATYLYNFVSKNKTNGQQVRS